MKPQFANFDRNTIFLIHPSVQDWLLDNHLARFVVDVVSRLYISALENAYASKGSAALTVQACCYPYSFTHTPKEDLPESMSAPDELAQRENRLEAIAFAKEQKAYQKKLENGKPSIKKTGKKPGGRKPSLQSLARRILKTDLPNRIPYPSLEIL